VLAATVALTATLLTIARGWPQTSRIAVHKNVTGVSALSWTLMLACNMSWIVWTVGMGVIPVLLANVLAAAAAAAVLLTIARHSPLSTWQPLWAAAGSVVASVGLLAIGGDQLLSVALTVLTAVMVLPQVVSAYRTDASGVSAITWLLSVGSSICWPTYYLLIDRPVMILPNVAIFISAALILVRLYRVRTVPPARVETIGSHG
jgi:uncharacterized protein with PQ loop repeat